MSTVALVGSVLASVLAGTGVWLIWSSLVEPPPERPRRGLPSVHISAEAATAVVSAALVGGVVGWVLFAGVVPVVALFVFGATFPLSAIRRRDRQRRLEAAASWPGALEEIRMRTGSLGRSIPQALWEAGRHGPTWGRRHFGRPSGSGS